MPRLVRWAISHSNPENRGVHIIAKGNPNVIDMEIAYSKEREPGPEDPSKLDDADDNKPRKAKSTAPRMDLAALFLDGEGKARLVFYEVKRFDDGRLWGNRPPVLDQMEKYDKFLQCKESELKAAYRTVCELLLKLLPKKDLPSGLGVGRRLHRDHVEAPGVRGAHRAATKSELPRHRGRDWVWA